MRSRSVPSPSTLTASSMPPAARARTSSTTAGHGRQPDTLVTAAYTVGVPRFFVPRDPIAAGRAVIRGADALHLASGRRVTRGEELAGVGDRRVEQRAVLDTLSPHRPRGRGAWGAGGGGGGGGGGGRGGGVGARVLGGGRADAVAAALVLRREGEVDRAAAPPPQAVPV